MKNLALMVPLALLLPLAGCGSDPTTTVATTTAIAATLPPAATTTTVAPATTTTAAATTTTASVPAAPAIMPAVVCMNLQAAQNKIQESGVFYSRSKDATGKGRRQVVDSNWIVVSQSPAPGATITEGQAVLSVVKIGEPNSCG